MKKRILSIILVLTFVLLALPMNVSGGAANADDVFYQGKMSDFTAKIGGISAIDDGLFKINAHSGAATGSTTPNTLTDRMHARQAMWNGSLAEGKLSVTFDTAGIFAKRAPYGCSNPGTGTNDTGIIFGAKGIKAYSVPANGSVNNIENNTQFYFLYFSNNNLILALANKDNYVDNDGDGVNETQKAWMGAQKNSAGKTLQVDLASKYGTIWNAAKDAGEVELTVAFSATGALRVWVNGTHITELDAETGSLTPFGPEIGVRAGMGYHVATEIRDFKIHGGLEIKTGGVGTTVYDPMTYTWSANHTKHYDGGAVAVGYVTNRFVTNGKIVIMAQQVPDVAHTNGNTCPEYLAGEPCSNGAHYTNNYYIGAIFNASFPTGGKDAYYMLSMKDTQVTKGGLVGPGAVSIQTRLSKQSNNTWTADPSGVSWKVVQHTNAAPYTPADPITFGNGTVAWPSGTTDAFQGTNASTYKVASWTDSAALTGGYYGFRTDVFNDAYKAYMDSMEGKWPSTSPARNANEGAYVQYYVINNQAEAMDLSLNTGSLDLANLEMNKDYEVTVSTFPAGSVINSGDTISLGGNGVKTLSTKDNGDGTYTVKFRATKEGAVTLSASVDNHIFGTLTTDSVSATVADTGVVAPTGDATFVVGVGVVLAAVVGAAVITGKKRSVA